eukprot:g32201.t1
MKTQVDTAVGQDLAQDLGSIFDKDQSVTAQVAANLAEGKHVRLSSTEKFGEMAAPEVLAASMLFHFLASQVMRKQLAVAPDQQHLPAVCRCHGKTLEIGHVCSCCLSIYCSDASAICQTCGTRFKLKRDFDPKIKDLDPEELERLIFASFLTQEVENRTYDEVTDMQAMKTAIEEYLDEYNQVFSIIMPLVMFLDACEHCARICRVLSQPNGNVLLLGVGGSGRQSLTRLSAYMNEADCFQIEVAKGYGMTEFKDDVKRCLMKCGIVKEDFVEAINNVLNSGDVPNLYANEDFEAISSSCRQLCQTGEPSGDGGS